MKLKSYSLVSLLFAAALMGCSRIEETSPPTEVGDFAYNFLIASDEASADISADPSVKSTYGEDHIVWENGDLVSSYALTSRNQSTPVEIDNETGKRTITIKSSVALNAGDKVYAYYPYNSEFISIFYLF